MSLSHALYDLLPRDSSALIDAIHEQIATAVAAEREACAMVVEKQLARSRDNWVVDIPAAIRRRANELPSVPMQRDSEGSTSRVVPRP